MACAPACRATSPSASRATGRRYDARRGIGRRAPRRAARASPAAEPAAGPGDQHDVARAAPPSATPERRHRAATVPSTVTATTAPPPRTRPRPRRAAARSPTPRPRRLSCTARAPPRRPSAAPVPGHAQRDQRTHRRGTHRRQIAQGLHQSLPTHVGRAAQNERSKCTPSTTLSTETTRDSPPGSRDDAGVVTQAEQLNSVSQAPPNRLHTRPHRRDVCMRRGLGDPTAHA